MLSIAYNSLAFAKMWAFPDPDGNLIGILGDMLNSLSSRLKFQMNATGIPVSDYGTKLQNGSFTGFVGMLQRGEFDIVASDTTITTQAIEQTLPIKVLVIIVNCIFFFRGARWLSFHFLFNLPSTDFL